MRFLPTRRHRIAAAVLTLVLPSAWLLAGERRGTDAMVVAPVKRGPFTVVVTTAGELRARQFVQVTAPPGGQQAGVYQMKISSIVPEGTVVKQGDVVAELDRTTVAPKLQEVTLALQKADAQYEQAMLDSTLNLSTARERSEEHTSELQSQSNLVCRLLLEKKKTQTNPFAGVERVMIRHLVAAE